MYSNQMDLEHIMNTYVKSLAQYQSDAIPVNEIHNTTENLTYVARNEKGMSLMGQDPHWDREHVFEGYVRAPLDAKTKDYGFIWSEHIYNMNPLAGTGTENLDFLAGGIEQQLTEMNLLPDIGAAQGAPIAATSTNMLDPSSVQENLYAQEKMKESVKEYREAAKLRGKGGDDDDDIDVGEKLLHGAYGAGQTLVIDRNILQSRGVELVKDPQGRHEIFTHDGTPIQYYIDGSLQEAQKEEEDALGTEPLDNEGQGPYEWMDWFGYHLPISLKRQFPQSDSVKGTEDRIHEDLMSNNVLQVAFSRAQQDAADEYTMKDYRTKQMFLDYDRPFDPIPLHQWDANDTHQMNMEDSSKRFDLVRLR